MGPKPFPYRTLRLSLRVLVLLGVGPATGAAQATGGFTTAFAMATVHLDPGESVILFRGFRDFVGPYVAHCHNLAHEDHAMMFAWRTIP